MSKYFALRVKLLNNSYTVLVYHTAVPSNAYAIASKRTDVLKALDYSEITEEQYHELKKKFPQSKLARTNFANKK